MKKVTAHRTGRIVTRPPAKVVSRVGHGDAGFGDEEVTREIPAFTMAELLEIDEGSAA